MSAAHKSIGRYITNHTVLAVTLFSYLMFFPVSLLQRPIWDGALSRFAMSNSYQMLNQEAFDYGLPSLYLHEMLITSLSKLVQIDYYILYNLTVAFCIGGIFKLILVLAQKLQIETQLKNGKVVTGFMLVTYPALHTLYTTQNFIWLLCILILLAGINALFHEKKKFKIIGILLIGFSFQMASLPFVFLPIYWWYHWVTKREKFIVRLFSSSILSALMLILIREILFPPKNLYLHYNEIVFNKHFIKMTAINIFNFSLFLFIFIILILGLNGKLSWPKKNSTLRLVKNSNTIFISLLSVGSCFPYVMANKSPKPLDFFDWSWRHTIILLIPFTLLTLMLQTTKETPVKERNQKVQIIVKSLAFLIFVSMTLLSNYGHVQSMVYDKKVIELLSNNRNSWSESEIVCFESSVRRMNNVRFYELNEMAWESTGRTNWQFYPDTKCSSKNIPSGSLRNSPQLSGMTDMQWKNVYMGGTTNSKWIAIRISGKLDFLDVLYSTFGGDDNHLKISFSRLESGTYKGVDELN